MQQILHINQEPAYTTVLRSPGGIPQLERNYPQLLHWREKFLAAQPGLQIIGFGWKGIGLNDMMKHASRAAKAVLASSSARPTGPEVKGVYF